MRKITQIRKHLHKYAEILIQNSFGLEFIPITIWTLVPPKYGGTPLQSLTLPATQQVQCAQFVAIRKSVAVKPVDKISELQIELINQSLAELHTYKKRTDKPRNRIGFITK